MNLVHDPCVYFRFQVKFMKKKYYTSWKFEQI